MAAPRLPDAGIALRFGVQIDRMMLASFTGCSGLGAQYEVLQWREGGDNGTVLTLPGRLTYTPVRLTRPVDRFSSSLASWFAEQYANPSPTTATITLYDPSFAAKPPIAHWALAGAWPMQYSGPTLSATAQGETIAIETLVLAHQGFAP